ncbi:hypothetical protein [Paenibacillus polymyxa]|uniref:hypothetical protein n=1 Tax=Paenibacillus polymyxa TaxID=1406 RepID=UPI0004DECE9C|nr:hypothetical protein [Paenibacillus polymyxa]RPE03319.1 hypothetical protein EG487_14680 [Paenibacillus polymyxa]
MKKMFKIVWVIGFVIFVKLIKNLEYFFQDQMSITLKYQPYLTYQWILYFLLGIYFSFIFVRDLRLAFKSDIFFFAFLPSLFAIIYCLVDNYLFAGLSLIFMLSGSLLFYSLFGEKK